MKMGKYGGKHISILGGGEKGGGNSGGRERPKKRPERPDSMVSSVLFGHLTAAATKKQQWAILTIAD